MDFPNINISKIQPGDISKILNKYSIVDKEFENVNVISKEVYNNEYLPKLELIENELRDYLFDNNTYLKNNLEFKNGSLHGKDFCINFNIDFIEFEKKEYGDYGYAIIENIDIKHIVVFLNKLNSNTIDYIFADSENRLKKYFKLKG